MNWDKIRDYFPITKEYAFFDLANKCGLPTFVTDVIQDYITKQQAFGGDKQEWFETLEEARGNFAKLVNASIDEIAFTKNTSEGLNIAANCLPLKKGDTVLLNENEHPNNVYCWLNLASRGINVKWIPTEIGSITVENIEKMIDDSVKVVSFSSVTYAPGNKNDVKSIVDFCKGRGIYTVVDAVQSVGTMVVDVKKLGMDILCTSGHKSLFTPHGVGVIYINKDLLDDMQPVYVARAGMGMAAQIEYDKIEYKLDQADNARKFEIGNYNYLGITAFNEALKFLLSLGMENVERRILEIYAYLLSELNKMGIEVISPQAGSSRTAILCFKYAKARDLHNYLMNQNVINTLRRDMIRISIGLYNNKQDVDDLVLAIKSYQMKN